MGQLLCCYSEPPASASSDCSSTPRSPVTPRARQKTYSFFRLMTPEIGKDK